MPHNNMLNIILIIYFKKASNWSGTIDVLPLDVGQPVYTANLPLSGVMDLATGIIAFSNIQITTNYTTPRLFVFKITVNATNYALNAISNAVRIGPKDVVSSTNDITCVFTFSANYTYISASGLDAAYISMLFNLIYSQYQNVLFTSYPVLSSGSVLFSAQTSNGLSVFIDSNFSSLSISQLPAGFELTSVVYDVTTILTKANTATTVTTSITTSGTTSGTTSETTSGIADGIAGVNVTITLNGTITTNATITTTATTTQAVRFNKFFSFQVQLVFFL